MGRLAGLTALACFVAACSSPSGSPAVQSAAPPSAGPTPSSSQAALTQPPACVEARLAWAPALHRLLLLNCVDQPEANPVEEVWSWDGRRWSLLADDGPPATVVAGMAYDTARGVAIRYGGLPATSNDCVPQTWEWDGDAWRQADASPPTACDHMELVYDSARADTVLVGGQDASGVLSPETWTWDGAAWRRVAETGPPPRAHFGFVYDEAHARAIVYGGFDGHQVFDDMWSWDGSAWTAQELPGVGPGPRSHLSLALGGGGLLLFGGATTTASFRSLTDETWYLIHGAWSQLEAPGPTARGSAVLGWDPERSVFVLYGGFTADGGGLADTWEWDGAGWRCVDGCPAGG